MANTRFSATDELMRESLLRIAIFAETHSIKGLLTIEELSALVPEPHDGFWEAAVNWDQLLDAPKVNGLLSRNIDLSAARFSDARIKSLIDGGVFPMAYWAAVEWVKRRGLRDLILAFQATAIERIGHLGHSWTIWCSFLEVEPRLKKDEHKFLAAERFAEFVASQLSHPDWLPKAPLNEMPPKTTATEAISAVCERPGFLGHSLITLAHLFRYRDLFSAAQWDASVSKVTANAKDSRQENRFNKIYVPSPAMDGAPSSEELVSVISEFLTRSQHEVHSLTMANSLSLLWAHASEIQRRHLLVVLPAFIK